MEALEYMEKQLLKHQVNYHREKLRSAPEYMLENIRLKISYYEAAIEALRKVNELVQCKECERCDNNDPYGANRDEINWCHKFNHNPKEDDFCSYGERKG